MLPSLTFATSETSFVTSDQVRADLHSVMTPPAQDLGIYTRMMSWQDMSEPDRSTTADQLVSFALKTRDKNALESMVNVYKIPGATDALAELPKLLDEDWQRFQSAVALYAKEKKLSPDFVWAAITPVPGPGRGVYQA